METHKTDGTVCPRCGYDLGAHTGLGHSSEPKVGDYTVCSKCFKHLRFSDDMELEEVDIMKLVKIAFENPELYGNMIAARDIAREARKRIKKDSE